MKIVILVGSLTMGGAERVASLWARGFQQQGHIVHVVLNSNSIISYDIPEEIQVQNLYSKKKSKIAGWVKYIYKLRLYLKQIRPDVIISVLEPHGLAAQIATTGMGIPIINTEHNTFDYPFSAPLIMFRKLFVNKIYDKVTVLTQADKLVIGSKLKNAIVLPNPLSFEMGEIDYSVKEKTLLAVGRIEAYNYKGFDLLIKSWSMIAKKYPEWTMKIVGQGSSQTKELLYSYAECDLGQQLEFVDYTANILDFYKRAEIFVLSSRYEGFGMVLLEAMSQGCACIACDYKGRQQEIIGDVANGMVIPVNDVDALCHAMEDLLTNESRRKAFQQQAPKRAAVYSLDNIMLRWNDILKTVVVK